MAHHILTPSPDPVLVLVLHVPIHALYHDRALDHGLVLVQDLVLAPTLHTPEEAEDVVEVIVLDPDRLLTIVPEHALLPIGDGMEEE